MGEALCRKNGFSDPGGCRELVVRGRALLREIKLSTKESDDMNSWMIHIAYIMNITDHQFLLSTYMITIEIMVKDTTPTRN